MVLSNPRIRVETSCRLQDLAPSLEQYERAALLTKLTQQAVRCFNELPPELNGPASLANEADAMR